MVFDANLVLAAAAEWTQSNIDTYGEPVLTTDAGGGFKIIDLLDEHGVMDLCAVFIADEVAARGATDELTLTIEGSTSPIFASGSIHRLATFDIAAATLGIILGNEIPAVVVRRFDCPYRYIRAHAEVNASADFNTCQVLLATHPWKTL